jgi:hypothetical protein
MQRGYAGLKPPDACHLAAASVANVDEMHTFDQKLLDLDGVIDMVNGAKLKICKPALGGPKLPLLEPGTMESAGDLASANETGVEGVSEQASPDLLTDGELADNLAQMAAGDIAALERDDPAGGEPK